MSHTKQMLIFSRSHLSLHLKQLSFILHLKPSISSLCFFSAGNPPPPLVLPTARMLLSYLFCCRATLLVVLLSLSPAPSFYHHYSVSPPPRWRRMVAEGFSSLLPYRSMDKIPTTGSVSTSAEEKQILAKTSLTYNCKMYSTIRGSSLLPLSR
ncbi:uncharacterized protein [Spinacia oleracea]|uniref:Ig-like domain-containing protein n=1 Tax=Spinacia oleracea TaxID=3562 RepID=A0A9R0J0X9_SPIOL|nr:uncharacterized protein LOC110797220 [Spinacia oleracea]